MDFEEVKNVIVRLQQCINELSTHIPQNSPEPIVSFVEMISKRIGVIDMKSTNWANLASLTVFVHQLIQIKNDTVLLLNCKMDKTPTVICEIKQLIDIENKLFLYVIMQVHFTFAKWGNNKIVIDWTNIFNELKDISFVSNYQDLPEIVEKIFTKFTFEPPPIVITV